MYKCGEAIWSSNSYFLLSLFKIKLNDNEKQCSFELNIRFGLKPIHAKAKTGKTTKVKKAMLV